MKSQTFLGRTVKASSKGGGKEINNTNNGYVKPADLDIAD